MKKWKISKIFFLNDEDGFSSRDFLLVTSMGMYFVLFVYCMWSLVTQHTIPESAFSLFASTDGVVITVVGGTMGVVGIEKFVASRKKEQVEYPEAVYSEEGTQPAIDDHKDII